ncbi:MAG: restriction endonuclease subunit S [Gammaproteobacteria bacterium]|nr:restriction endonuclease subunit S [Gammaproteobacteria bacterium]
MTEETFQSWTRRSQPRFGDVILTREAPVGEVGRCTFDDDKNIFLGQRLFLYRPDPELLDWNYLAYVLQSPLMQSKLHGMSFGATVPHIKVGYAENLEIPCPSLDIQKSIGSLLAAYDDLIEVNRRRICLLEESARLLYREWFVNLRFPGCELVRRTEGIPEGWSRERLDSALLLQRGFDLPNGVRKPGNIPIYASAGINGYHNEAKVKGPGIVTGRSGTLGLVHYVSGDFWPLNTALWVKEFRRVTPLFAYFMLSEMNLAQYNSGASVPSLDRKVVHPVEILIPPERVIGQFGEYVEPLFEQVEYLREANLRAAEARDALLPKLMSGAIQV